MTTSIPAYIFARQSLDRRGDELAVSRQLEDGRALAARHGLSIDREWAENNVSAAGKQKRPTYTRMMDELEAAEGRIRALVAWDMSRLCRTSRDQLRLWEVGERWGLTIYLVRTGAVIDLTTAAGRIIGYVMAEQAREEIAVKGARQRAQAAQAAQAGRPPAGPRRFGFEPDGVTLREAEAQAIRDGYDMLLSGVPLAGIAREWNRRGLPTPRQTRDGRTSWWNARTVRGPLRNAAYAGLRAYQGEIIGAGEWPAIVSEETWQAARALLADPGRRTLPHTQGRYLLSGIATCGVCAAPVVASRTTAGTRIYRCRATPGHIARSAAPVEEYIGALVVARLMLPDAVDLVQQQDDRPDIEGLRSEGATLRGRLEEIAVAVADGGLTVSQARVATDRIRRRLGEIATLMAEAGRTSAVAGLMVADDVADAWGEYTVEQQRAVIDALMEITLLPPGRGARTFNPDRVRVQWR